MYGICTIILLALDCKRMYNIYVDIYNQLYLCLTLLYLTKIMTESAKKWIKYQILLWKAKYEKCGESEF